MSEGEISSHHLRLRSTVAYAALSLGNSCYWEARMCPADHKIITACGPLRVRTTGKISIREQMWLHAIDWVTDPPAHL